MDSLAGQVFLVGGEEGGGGLGPKEDPIIDDGAIISDPNAV